jgi:hypothetical protein
MRVHECQIVGREFVVSGRDKPTPLDFVARKLAVIMHTMLKTGELFDPNAGATAEIRIAYRTWLPKRSLPDVSRAIPLMLLHCCLSKVRRPH